MLFTYDGKKYELILLCVTGSRMYGTHYESGDHPLDKDYISDYDYRGVFVAHESEKIGLIPGLEQISPNPEPDKGSDEEKEREKNLNTQLIKSLNKKGLNLQPDSDIVLYEVKKFIKLSAEENPNILDVLYADDESKLFESKKGKVITSNKEMFLTKKVINKFMGYAQKQLHRIKGHNKHINKRPNNNDVVNAVRSAFHKGDVDYNWITLKFSGKLANMVTEKSQEDANSDEKVSCISIEEFHQQYLPQLTLQQFNKYKKPELVDYLTLKNLHGKKISLNSQYDEKMTYREMLKNKSSFRKISNSVYNIFSSVKNGGFITRNGDIKNQEPQEVGDFVVHCSVNKEEYVNAIDEVKDFWHWRTHRNKKRSALEERFGYDTKHASHLVRLMTCAKELADTGYYVPRLEGDRLTLAKDIIEGKYQYETVVQMSEQLQKEALISQKHTSLKSESDYVAINDLLVSISNRAEDKRMSQKLKS